MKWRSIQCLRAVAAVAVLVYHFGNIALGAAGVDLFFVISGFIMASVVPGSSSGRFLGDRAWRILPPYYAAVALEILLIQSPVTAHQLLVTLTLWPVGIPILHHSWTLSFEMLFYVGCACYLAVGRVIFLLIPLALIAPMLVDHPLVGFVGHPLIVEFLAGMVIARLPRRFGGTALIAALAVLLMMPTSADRILSFGIPSMLLVHGILSFEPQFRSRGWTPLLSVGDASYSIYLVHLTIGRLFSDDVPWVTAASVALIGGLLFHKIIEQPLLRYRGLTRSRRTSSANLPIELPIESVSLNRTAN